jgi:hypothetical protein
MTKKSEEKKLKEAIRTAGNILVAIVKEEIFLCEISLDDERLSRLMHLLSAHINYEFLKEIHDAGLDRDITELADKAGNILREVNNK